VAVTAVHNLESVSVHATRVLASWEGIPSSKTVAGLRA
jgi:hypothetical protein